MPFPKGISPKVSAIAWLEFKVTKAKETSQSNDLPIAGERRDGFMPFLKALVQHEIKHKQLCLEFELILSCC